MRIAFYGIGLLGGSLARAVRERFDDAKIFVFDTDESACEQALGEGVADSVIADYSAIPDADVHVVALPVCASIDLIKKILELSKDGTVIDLGSVKQGVIEGVFGHPESKRFVPCHPMAGSEKSGYAFSDASLFKGSAVFITPHSLTDLRRVENIKIFWEKVGSIPVVVDAAIHDLGVAYTSHLPHLVSCALAKIVSNRSENGRDLDLFAGRGFRDMTRLAAGSPAVWADICSMNRNDIVHAIDDCMEELESMRIAVKSNDMEAITQYFISSVSGVKKMNSSVKRVFVAVDGPAGSGKSSVSKIVASKADLTYIDSGAIYRAITWYMLEKFGNCDPGRQYGQIARDELRITQSYVNGVSKTSVNGRDVSDSIRDERITKNIGSISDNREIRDYVTSLLREWATKESIIMDGRDIGTVVFPDADIKIYCDATSAERAKRRHQEYLSMGKNVDVKEIESQIILRDEQDRNRAYGALKIADDALVLDTSNLSRNQVVDTFLDIIRKYRS